MTPRLAFELIYAPLVKRHLRAVEPTYHSFIREAIELQFKHEPDVETKNRKPLKRPILWGAKWELRCGPNNRFRVFYKVDRKVHEVDILAIGEKRGERLRVGREEIEL
jgi:mRNA-degrading endonuclease RelE of RelBE toxin-antitoxin system